MKGLERKMTGFERRVFFVSVLLIGIIVTVSALAPLFSPYGMNEIDLDRIAAGPSTDHVLGTDGLGRDLFTRVLYGGRVSLLAAFASVLISLATGILLGGLAGALRGPVDRAVTALTDVFLSVPVFLVILAAASAAGRSFWAIPVIIGFTSWMETARTVRAKFFQIREEEFVAAARSLGAGGNAIFFRHMLPQALMPVAVSATSGFAGAMLIESSLSFLGFGIQPPVPSWGNMLHDAQSMIRMSPLTAFVPGLMIFISCLAFNFIADRCKHLLARGDAGR